MTKRKAKSAADFLTELNADPDYVASRDIQEGARALREAQIRSASQPLLEELMAAGYPLTSLAELLTRYAPLPAAIVDILLDRLAEMQDPAVQEQIVRALGASAVPIPAEQLIMLFRTTESNGLRYAIANTMAQAEVQGAGAWLLEAVRNPGFGVARQMLALAVARRAPRVLANPILVGLLDDLPGHAALALAESGEQQEVRALEVKYPTASGWEKQEIGRAISVIRRRLAES